MTNCCIVPFCEGPVAKACPHGWLCDGHECGDHPTEQELAGGAA